MRHTGSTPSRRRRRPKRLRTMTPAATIRAAPQPPLSWCAALSHPARLDIIYCGAVLGLSRFVGADLHFDLVFRLPTASSGFKSSVSRIDQHACHED